MFLIPYRLEIGFETTLRAVNVPATVLWDGDRIYPVNTTLRDATVVVLPYQVALRLQAAGEMGAVACSPKCGHAAVISTLQLDTVVIATRSIPVIQP